MSTSADRPQLPASIQDLLSGLRVRIRAYVLLEGLLLGFVWVGLVFWLGLALDYLPVLVGANEMPVLARGLMLTVAGIVLGAILYRWVLRRTFVRLADRSMAILLERRYGNFQDRLVTSVEMSERPDHAVDFNADMLRHTSAEAQQHLPAVRLNQVFDFRPLVTKFVVALLLLAPAGVLYASQDDMLRIWSKRLFLLDEEPWPRRAAIEIVGIEVRRDTSGFPDLPTGGLVRFGERTVKVAKGASVNVQVRANTAAEVVPDYCHIQYRTEEGDSGRVPMKKVGVPRDGFQYYAFDGKPFARILSTITFDVIGYDHRIRNHSVRVVESPAVLSPVAACVFPGYMVDEQLGSWLPRDVPLDTSVQIPRGTKLTIRARATKDLEEVFLFNPDAKADEPAERTESFDDPTGPVAAPARTETAKKPVRLAVTDPDRRQFEWEVPSLQENLTLDIMLRDTDQVLTERPHRLTILAVEDQPPKIELKLRGIGSVVTPDVVMPGRGTVTDDYGVARAWWDVDVNGEPREYGVPLRKNGAFEARVDFREIRADKVAGYQLQPRDRLVVSIRATDKYDLEGFPHEGIGDRFQLEVVTPNELLAALERRELELRRRFEHVVEEVTAMRDSLVRVRTGGSESSAGAEPEDKQPAEKPEKSDKPAEKPADKGSDPADKLDKKPVASATPEEKEKQAERLRSLKLLLIQQALLQSQKSAREVEGVAESFDEIREELTNNRVDTEDRKIRLKEKISDPLRATAKADFPELDKRMTELEALLRSKQEGTAVADRCVEQANEIVAKLDAVLQDMLQLETFKELVGILRELIGDQEGVLGETERLQADDPFGLK